MPRNRIRRESPVKAKNNPYRIGVIGGDGIGPEVTAEALKVLDAVGFDYTPVVFDLGGTRYLRDGEILPADDLAAIRECDAVLLGAVGTPEVAPGVIERGLLLRLRFELDLYANVRPFLAPASVYNDGVDMVVVRENTEGTYAGDSCATTPSTKWRPKGRSTLAMEWSVVFVTPLHLRPLENATTSPWFTKPMCLPSRAISGSGLLTRWRRTIRPRAPRTTISMPRVYISFRTPVATT